MEIQSPWALSVRAPLTQGTRQVREDVPTEPETVTARPARRVGALMLGVLSLMGAAAPKAFAQSSSDSPSISRVNTPVADTTSTPKSTEPPASLTIAPPDSTTRTKMADGFLADWLGGVFDGRVGIGHRLDRAFRTKPEAPQTFPFQEGLSSRAPSVSDIGRVGSFEGLRNRVDGRFQGPFDFNQVALDMGQRFGSENYAYGRGGSIIGDTNAFDLYNTGQGVCVEIHSGIAAYRRAHGQEAYVVGSTAVGNSHAFTIFKDNGKWYVQNYGRVVETDARNLRELFDRAMPEEVRPSLFEPQADGTLRPVGRGFVTSMGMDARRFSDFSGTGDYDPFIHGGGGAGYRDGRILLFGNGSHLSVDPSRQEVSGGLGYHLEDSGARQTVSGFSGKARFDTQDVKAKWERESRWDMGDRFGRSHVSVFGGAEFKGPSPQYWSTRADRSIGQIGAHVSHEDSRLHGSGPVRLETGYNGDARLVWTYGLDQGTRDAFTGGQNGQGGGYLGDLNRMVGDASGSLGLHSGVHYQPGEHLRVRGGVRMGANLANWQSTTFTTGARMAFEPSAYGEVRYAANGLVAGALADVPLNENGNFRLVTAVGYAPTEKLVVGASYGIESFLGEKYDHLQLGAGWNLTPTVQIQGGAYVPQPGRDGLKHIGGQGGIRVNF